MKRRTPEENREKSRLHRERCRAEGLCFRCLARLDCESVQHCRACLLWKREYRRNYGGHKAQKPDDVTSKRYLGLGEAQSARNTPPDDLPGKS